MKKINLIFLILLLISLAGCQSIQKSLVPQKKTGATEFLVKKKSPLVMPPSYGELPIPTNEKTSKKNQTNNIESLIIKKKNDENLENIEPDKNFEQSILEKIKNN